MGYYIHNCEKMRFISLSDMFFDRYKANYKPSQLLCLESFEWYDADDCIRQIDATEGCLVSRFADVDMNRIERDVDLGQCRVGVTKDTYNDPHLMEQKKTDLRRFYRLVGVDKVMEYNVLLYISVTTSLQPI